MGTVRPHQMLELSVRSWDGSGPGRQRVEGIVEPGRIGEQGDTGRCPRDERSLWHPARSLLNHAERFRPPVVLGHSQPPFQIPRMGSVSEDGSVSGSQRGQKKQKGTLLSRMRRKASMAVCFSSTVDTQEVLVSLETGVSSKPRISA
jgi:hypothetical protein